MKKNITEKKDNQGIERSRFKRLINSVNINIRAEVRILVNSFKIWQWPSYLWANAVNACKYIVRFGTGKNSELVMDLKLVLKGAADGKYKTGKEMNNAINATLKKHGMKTYKMYEQKDLPEQYQNICESLSLVSTRHFDNKKS